MRVVYSIERLKPAIKGFCAMKQEALTAILASAPHGIACLPGPIKEGRLFSYRPLFSMLKNAGCEEIVLCPMEEDEACSSIRHLLSLGDVQAAAEELGRPYDVYGRVIHGRNIGNKELGVPTANLRIKGRAMPKGGVYLTRVWYHDDPCFAVSNLGHNPTVGETDELSLESHLLDFYGDLYGKVIRVEFLERIRDEQRFESFEELKAAIEGDIKKAHELSRKY